MARVRHARRRVLIADTPEGARKLRVLFGDHIDFVSAHAFDDALERLRAARPDLVMLGYHFDQFSPYRLIASIRQDRGHEEIPIVLVRMLPFKMGASTEKEVRRAYRDLGVQQFFSIPDELGGEGRDRALGRMRAEVFALLGMEEEASPRRTGSTRRRR